MIVTLRRALFRRVINTFIAISNFACKRGLLLEVSGGGIQAQLLDFPGVMMMLYRSLPLLWVARIQAMMGGGGEVSVYY